MCIDYPSRNLARLVPLRDLVLILIVVVFRTVVICAVRLWSEFFVRGSGSYVEVSGVSAGRVRVLPYCRG